MHALDPSLAMAWAVATLLIATRLGALLWMAPLLHAVPVPTTVRVLLVLGLAAVLAWPLAPDASWRFGSLPTLAGALLGEVAVGLALGLGVLLAFAGFQLAGRLLDLQVGFGLAQVYDPASRTQVSVLASILPWVGVLLFLGLDGHHQLLRGVVLSLQLLPPGGSWRVHLAAAPLMAQAAALFASGFSLAAPVVLALFLVDFLLGVAARNLPQLNLLVLAFPLKVMCGLFTLAWWLPLAGAAAWRLHAGLFDGWGGLLGAMGR
jgi:flagellar biosynthetic protein FliR